MAYLLLNPATATAADRAARAKRCALAVMAKAPRSGKVKTRLSPPLTLAQAAALNICFLKDTAENLAAVCASATRGREADPLLCYTPVGDESAFDHLLPASFALIPQRGEAFGERLLFAAQDILALGYASVCLIDSDSPTVPAAAFRLALEVLAAPASARSPRENRIVLGPSHDGGYYLIGLARPHAAPFDNITWSTSTVLEETLARCRAAHLKVSTLPLWYDVDDAPTLALLTGELLSATPPSFTTLPGYPSPHTAAFLADLTPSEPLAALLSRLDESQ